MLALALYLQVQVTTPQTDSALVRSADSVYGTAALRDFIAFAARANRAPPPSLTGYEARVESELALILRDSLGREIVGQIEQLAARAQWERTGRYELHVVGFRSQSAGAPYSALTWTRMYTVPTLYGNRLVIGMNDGIARSRSDSNAARKRLQKDTAAGREPFRTVHPLAVDREKYYRFSGGDTVATLYSLGRAIRLMRVHVEPIKRKESNFYAFTGELDFDAERRQLVRMRGSIDFITSRKDPLLARGTGAVGMAYVEFENAEVNGKYWLPAFQRSEFQVQMGLMGDTRPIYRIVSRFREYAVSLRDTVVFASQMGAGADDTTAPTDTIPRTRAKLTFASKDSVSRFGAWRDNLGTASAAVDGDDFDDLAPDPWKPTGKPRVDHWPRRLEEIARYNRVEGMFTGYAGSVRFRDMVPGLSARWNVGWAWEEQTPRGTLAATLARGHWIHGARAERTLASTNDFLLALESGLSIGPLFTGTDDQDYVDRWTAAYGITRILKDVDHAILTTEVGYGFDRSEEARLRNGVLGSSPFRPNRPAATGYYTRAITSFEWHPRVNGMSLSPGLGMRLSYEIGRGNLDWQRIQLGLSARRYWRGVVFASRLDGGTVLGSNIPPQQLFEMGGGIDLPSYGYKEFGGDRAALGRGLVAYHFPVMRTPRRVLSFMIPGLGPGVGAGVQGGWTEVSSSLAQSGAAFIPTPTGRVRAAADFRFTLFSGAIGAGMARHIDRAGQWKPFFVWGASF